MVQTRPNAQWNGGSHGLPVALGDGMLLKTACNTHDAERVAAFNASVHKDEAIAVFTRWRLGGTHPTVRVSDFLFVEDTKSHEIVSTLGLVVQPRTYEGIPLQVGHVELVGTHPITAGAA